MKIIIAPYDPAWPLRFGVEKQRIAAALLPLTPEVAHVGSTSVPGLGAKNTVDILIGLEDFRTTADAQISKFQAMGYDYWSIYEDTFPERRLFCMEKQGQRLFNVHMVEENSDFWQDHLRFRDILRQDGRVREAYYRLKVELAEREWEHTNDYADAKGEFIRGVLQTGEL